MTPWADPASFLEPDSPWKDGHPIMPTNKTWFPPAEDLFGEAVEAALNRSD